MLEIVQAGHPVLRRPARTLTRDEIRTPELQELIEQMRETMRGAPGVGLAAPQIGLPLRLAVIEDRAEYLEGLDPDLLADRDRRPVPFHVIINPKITLDTTEQAAFFEGCLSVRGLSAVVRRAVRVEVDALNDEGDPIHIRASGWYARILQHEIDHLGGVLYVDRMQSPTLTSCENYERFWVGMPISDVLQAVGVASEPLPRRDILR